MVVLLRRAVRGAVLPLFFGLALPGAVAQAGGDAERMDLGTEFQPPQVFVIGPVVSCGNVKMPPGVRSNNLTGCPAVIEVIPGYYRPVPAKGWMLVRANKLHSSRYIYEVVHHWLIGLIPLTVSRECAGPKGPDKGTTFVLSWEAAPYLREEEPAVEVAGRESGGAGGGG